MSVKTFINIVLLVGLVLVIPSTNYATSFDGKVVAVSDGDTINVLKDGKQVKIRLASIDCPEKGQPYGQEAKQFTADMVAGKVVKVWETGIDRYGLVVGFVFIGGKNLNKELLSAGLAWHDKKYSRDPALVKLEFRARSAKLGLWAEPDPVPPWEWRRIKNNKSYINEVKPNQTAQVHFLELWGRPLNYNIST